MPHTPQASSPRRQTLAVLFAVISLYVLPVVARTQAVPVASGSIEQVPEQAAPTKAQAGILTLTNRDRTAQGLQPLQWSPALAAAAQTHAEAMAQAGTLSHQLPGEQNVADRAAHDGAHFQSVAENIAYGPSPATIEHEWMHSVPHRANILDPRMNSIGVGLVSAGGTLWAVEDFADAMTQMDPSAVEAEVGQELSAHGVAIVLPDSAEMQAARTACPEFEGGAGAHARFVVRWEGANMQQLPGPLGTAVSSGQYTRAAVAACPAINHRNTAFTVYRVAVLLF
jgi:uncharacterized protein YkwD